MAEQAGAPPTPPAVPAVAVDTPVTKQGAVINPPATGGLPTTEALPATVQELVDAVSPPNSPPVSPGAPLVTTGVPGGKEVPAAAAPDGEPAAEPAAEPAKDRWAELADRERALQQSRRAFDFQDQQQRARAAAKPPAEAPGESAAEYQARLRSDPAKALADAGMGLQDLADRVVAGPTATETPEVQALKAQLAEVQATQAQQAEQQQVAQQNHQYQEMHAGLVTGLEGAKESYPNLMDMLSKEEAATAILQGIQNSYNAGTGVYTQDADTVAQGLEAHLKGRVDRLLAGRQPAADSPPQPSQLAPNPEPRLNNGSTAAPQTPPGRLTRNDEIERAAQSLRYTEPGE